MLKRVQPEGGNVMNRHGKAVILVVGGFAVLAIVVASTIVLLTKERDLRLATERQLSLVEAENADLEQQLQQIRQSKQEVETELARIKGELEQAAQQLAEERRAKQLLANAVDERQREIDRLGKDLEQIRTERTALTDQLAQSQKDRDAVQTQLADLERAKTELETKVLELSAHPTVELDKVVVTNAPPFGMSATPTSAVQGQVIVVNREYDFIVINLGKQQGLEIGQEFQIVRGQEVLGRVKVEKVYDELSAAAILPDSNKDAIREGDLVKAL